MKLYHGLKISGLSVLEPRVDRVFKKMSVVFATSDICFALSMICGTNDELAVGYVTNTVTGKEEMYIDELQPGGRLSLLESPGYVYEVESEGFYQLPSLMPVEWIKDSEAAVVAVTHIPNILAELKKHPISITSHGNVLNAMKERGLLADNRKAFSV